MREKNKSQHHHNVSTNARIGNLQSVFVSVHIQRLTHTENENPDVYNM